MPLYLAPIGEEQIIKKNWGAPNIRSHLEDLGFIVGGGVTIVSTIGGNLIVNVKNGPNAISLKWQAGLLYRQNNFT